MFGLFNENLFPILYSQMETVIERDDDFRKQTWKLTSVSIGIAISKRYNFKLNCFILE